MVPYPGYVAQPIYPLPMPAVSSQNSRAELRRCERKFGERVTPIDWRKKKTHANRSLAVSTSCRQMNQMDTFATARFPAWIGWPAALACAALLMAGPARSRDAGSARLDLLPQQWLDEQGQALPLTAFAGHRVILSMAYVQCHHTCPTTLARLLRMQAQLDARGEQATFVVIGYDPDQDTPASWRQYRVNRGLERSNWHFLTGSRDSVRQLAQQLGFAFWIYDSHVLHDPQIVVFNSEGLLNATLTDAAADRLALE
jgi:cytochrome oxidase Cu insertion factor (SCO1/SenC/PrrC family)